MKKGASSNSFHIDRLIERMWDVREKLQSDPENQSLWNQWIFIRRVLAHLIDRPARTAARSK